MWLLMTLLGVGCSSIDSTYFVRPISNISNSSNITNVTEFPTFIPSNFPSLSPAVCQNCPALFCSMIPPPSSRNPCYQGYSVNVKNFYYKVSAFVLSTVNNLNAEY